MSGRPSKVDQLPDALREGIEALWASGRYRLDDLLGFLNALAEGRRADLPPELADAPAVPPDALPGRSGLGAHLQGYSRLAERMRRSRDVAAALVKEVGQAPEDRLTQMNYELLQGVILDLFNGGEEGGPVTFDPEAVMLLGKALKDLSAARKADIDTTLRLRREFAAEAAKAAEKVAKSKGLSKDTVDLIKAEILGIAK